MRYQRCLFLGVPLYNPVTSLPELMEDGKYWQIRTKEILETHVVVIPAFSIQG